MVAIPRNSAGTLVRAGRTIWPKQCGGRNRRRSRRRLDRCLNPPWQTKRGQPFLMACARDQPLAMDRNADSENGCDGPSVTHAYSTSDALCSPGRQSAIFRGLKAPSPAPHRLAAPEEMTLQTNPVPRPSVIVRYCARPFNAHGPHYDHAPRLTPNPSPGLAPE